MKTEVLIETQVPRLPRSLTDLHGAQMAFSLLGKGGVWGTPAHCPGPGGGGGRTRAGSASDLGPATHTSPSRKPGLPSHFLTFTAVKVMIIKGTVKQKERIKQSREKVIGTEQKRPERRARGWTTAAKAK